MLIRLLLALLLIVLTGATFYFPGSTYLQSDTQIYAPILERAYSGPQVLAADPMVTRPHTGFTLYDEAAIGLRRLTGVGLERILFAEQILFRILQVFGFWLIATGLGATDEKATLITALASLGAAIAGPSVLTLEYEPVPRGFAVAALVLSLGLALHRRFAWAGTAAALATIFHAPTAWPIWPALFLAAIPKESKTAAKRPIVLVAAGLAASAIVLWIASRGTAAPPLFETIPPWLEQLQRMRASYNWVSEWKWQFFAHYVILSVVLIAAARAIKAPRWILLPAALGLLSIPLSWILLEQMKWALMPQFQPARAVLWITLLTVILATAAALEEERWWQRALWLLPAFWVPIQTIAVPESLEARPTLVVLALAAAIAVPLRVVPAFAALVFLAIPNLAGTRNYRTDLHTPALAQLAEWASANAAADSVFLFADAKHGLEPGVFRARSLRALYVDWKSGGQVNYFADYAREWKTRWEAAGKCEGDVSPAALGALGIDYAVFANRPANAESVYRNERYAVYRLNR